MFVRSLVLVGTVDVCSVALLDVVVLFVGSAYSGSRCCSEARSGTARSSTSCRS
jgi:hypothetical protein